LGQKEVIRIQSKEAFKTERILVLREGADQTHKEEIVFE
jgi:hypothetical protein